MRLPVFAASIFFLSLATACGGGSSGAPAEESADTAALHPLFSPENAYRSVATGEALVPDSEFLSPEAFAALVESGAYRLVTERESDDDLDRLRADADQEYREALAAFRDDADATRLIERRGAANDPNVRTLVDGNLLYRALPGSPDNGIPEQWFQLGGDGVGPRMLLNAQRSLPTLENQRAMYTDIHANLPEAYRLEMQLPDPQQVEGEDVEFFTALNLQIAADWLRFMPQVGPSAPPPGFPATWRDEEGAGATPASARGLDRAGPEELPVGLWSDVDFPLKWCATHVRSQGNRGTCAFFSVTAAVEARFAARRGRWVNLSEQVLYNQTRRVWAPSEHGDAGWPSVEMWNMRNNSFRFPFEREWDYNPSLFRINDGDRPRYLQSCWADATGSARYPGRWCSESNHQSPAICVRAAGRQFCATRDPGPDLGLPAGSSGIGIRRWVTVSDIDMPKNHTLAKLFLALKMPVTFCFGVPASGFGGPDGICSIDTPEPDILGSHCAVLLGYIRNVDLPPGVPPGDGGGYYIGKNSWGSWWGDRGYFYASDAWVDKYGAGLYAVTNVSG